jgi:sugar phosphate isomerase/epimerase
MPLPSVSSDNPLLTQASRREFIQVTGAAVLFGASADTANSRPKIGCLSACFHEFRAGANPEKAIDLIGEMGFEGIELFVCAKEDIPTYWTDSTLDRLKKQLERNRLQVSQLGLFQPVVEGLTSTDADERQRNLDAFEAGCRIASKLGSPIVNIVAPWARELRGPVAYLPRYYEIKDPKPGEKFHIDIASGFDWDRVWKSYIETTQACLQRAKQHRLRMTIEQHTHTMVQASDAFLRLWDAVRDPALGYNMDIGWTLAQREYPPVAIYKTKDHLMNLHARDIDGLMRTFVHVGEGVMDFKAVADALKAIGFRGYIDLEQDKHPGDMVATCKRYLSMMKEYLA